MARQNWQRVEGGFVLHGHRLSREDIKLINARLNGHEVRPKKRVLPIPESILPRNWIPSKKEEGPSEIFRNERLDLLQRLGEHMLEAAQEA